MYWEGFWGCSYAWYNLWIIFVRVVEREGMHGGPWATLPTLVLDPPVSLRPSLWANTQWPLSKELLNESVHEPRTLPCYSLPLEMPYFESLPPPGPAISRLGGLPHDKLRFYDCLTHYVPASKSLSNTIFHGGLPDFPLSFAFTQSPLFKIEFPHSLQITSLLRLLIAVCLSSWNVNSTRVEIVFHPGGLVDTQ